METGSIVNILLLFKSQKPATQQSLGIKPWSTLGQKSLQNSDHERTFHLRIRESHLHLRYTRQSRVLISHKQHFFPRNREQEKNLHYCLQQPTIQTSFQDAGHFRHSILMLVHCFQGFTKDSITGPSSWSFVFHVRRSGCWRANNCEVASIDSDAVFVTRRA